MEFVFLLIYINLYKLKFQLITWHTEKKEKKKKKKKNKQ